MAVGLPKHSTMHDNPTFFAQETDYSCAVACLRMVLSVYGIEQTEAELRELCDSGSDGTEALKLVDAARSLGLKRTHKTNLPLAELISECTSNRYPIVYVRTDSRSLPYSTQHAYVVIEANQDTITVLDPWTGRRELSTQEFEREWGQMRGLAILCQE